MINIFKLHHVLEMKMPEPTEVLENFISLDLEMSFVEQEDVFDVVEKLLMINTL